MEERDWLFAEEKSCTEVSPLPTSLSSLSSLLSLLSLLLSSVFFSFLFFSLLTLTLHCLDENFVHDKYYLDGLEEEIINGKFKVEEIPSTRRFYSQLLNPEEQSQYRQYLCLDRVTLEQDLNGQQLPDIEKKETANTNSPELLISEMVEYVKKNYSKSAASEFCTMCYRLLLRQGGRIDEDTAQLLDGIDSAIILRDAPHPNVDISSAHQVNINPQKVENFFKEAE